MIPIPETQTVTLSKTGTATFELRHDFGPFHFAPAPLSREHCAIPRVLVDDTRCLAMVGAFLVVNMPIFRCQVCRLLSSPSSTSGPKVSSIESFIASRTPFYPTRDFAGLVAGVLGDKDHLRTRHTAPSGRRSGTLSMSLLTGVPSAGVSFTRQTVYLLDDEKPPEYDMDSEDETYLAGLNKKPECVK